MTLAITILISAVVSLTLVPMMSARWLKRAEKKQSGFAGRAQAFFDRVMKRYDDALVWVIDHQAITLVVALLTFVLTVVLYLVIPKGLFPTQDTGQLQASPRRGAGRVVRPHGAAAAAGGAGDPGGSRRSTTSAPSSASTPPTTPCCTPAAC